MPKAYPEELLSLVKELSTHADIHALLKSMEGHKSVKLTAANKSELVDKNLRDALDGLAIPLDRVYDLVRDAEENGRQHIFYYVPATPKVKMTYSQAGEKLWGKGWEADKNFPRFDLVPNKFAYADLRQWNPHLKPLDWILKIYGHAMVEEQTGGDEHVDERTIRRTFVLEPKRLVIIIRWNSPNLLEIRVPEGDSNRRIDRWLDQAWEMMT